MQRLWAQTKAHGKQTGKLRAFLLSREPIKINYSAFFFCSSFWTKINSNRRRRKNKGGAGQMCVVGVAGGGGGRSRRTTHWIIHECRGRKRSIVLYLISCGRGSSFGRANGWRMARQLESDTKGMTIKNSKVLPPHRKQERPARIWQISLPTVLGPRSLADALT